jgi:hypothetical protein
MRLRQFGGVAASSVRAIGAHPEKMVALSQRSDGAAHHRNAFVCGNHAIDRLGVATLSSLRHIEPVAQPVEQLTFNQ